MLQALRNNMKIILFVVLVGFVVYMVAAGALNMRSQSQMLTKRGSVGKIGSVNIENEYFNQMVNNEINRVKTTQNKESLNEYEVEAIRERVWNQIVQDVLLNQEVQRLNIHMTSDEIYMSLRDNPPEIIRNEEVFLTDGQFDYQKYLNLLNDPDQASIWKPIERYLRQNMPPQKLGAYMVSTVRVTESEIKEAYLLKNRQMNAQVVYFNPYTYTVDSSEITDKDLQNYYKEHKSEFEAPEARKIKYVAFDFSVPTSDDSLEVIQNAESLIAQIKSGDDFAEIARKKSEHEESAKNGGDLGYFGRGDMDKSFEDAAFSAPIDSIVGPVATPHGIHIIRVNDRKREKGEVKIKAQHILLTYKTTDAEKLAKDSADDLVQELAENRHDSFDKIAEQEGYELQETPFFTAGGLITGIGMSMTMNRIAFKYNIGVILNPLTVENTVYVFQVSSIRKKHIKPFEEVRAQIERQIRREKQMEKARQDCEQFWEKVQLSDFDTVAHEDSLEILETGYFGFESTIPRVGRSAKFSGVAFGLSKGDVSKPVETDRGFYVIKAIDKTEFSETDYQSQKETIKNELQNKKLNMMYMAWLDNLKAHVKIKDYR